MKKMSLVVSCLGVLGLLWTVGGFDRALAESRVGNGGDSLAAEFVSFADETLQIVETLAGSDPTSLPKGFDLPAWKKSIQTAKVYTKDVTFVGDEEVDALNFPDDNKIQVSRKRWKGLGYNLKSTRLLVIHEYLGLSKQRDESYEISTQLVRKIQNGGSQGELWLLKDLDDPRYTNPFYGAFFETSFDNLRPVAAGAREVIFQGGEKVGGVDPRLPSCKIVFSTSLPSSAKTIKLPIMGANELSGVAGGEVSLDLQKSFVASFTCGAGTGGLKVTVKDALDSLGKNAFLMHFGAAQVGGGSCRN